MRIDIISVAPNLLESPFNHSIVKRAKDKGLKVKVHYFGEISQAIQEASDKAQKQVDSIPAYFKNGKYSQTPLF